MEKIKACKQKLSELKKYENIIKKKHASKTINKCLSDNVNINVFGIFMCLTQLQTSFYNI